MKAAPSSLLDLTTHSLVKGEKGKRKKTKKKEATVRHVARGPSNATPHQPVSQPAPSDRFAYRRGLCWADIQAAGGLQWCASEAC